MGNSAASKYLPTASIMVLADTLVLAALILGLPQSGFASGMILQTDPGNEPPPTSLANTVEEDNSPPSVSVPDYAMVLALQNTTYTATCSDADPSDQLRLTWYWGDGSLTVLECASTGGSFPIDAIHMFIEGGVFEMWIWIDDLTDLPDHNVSDTALVGVVSPPPPPLHVGISVDDFSPYVDETVNFSVQVSGGAEGIVYSVELDFDDGNYSFTNMTSGNTWVMQHAYGLWGAYDVLLSVWRAGYPPLQEIVPVDVLPRTFELHLVPGWNMVTVPLSGWGYKANTLGLSFGDVITRWDGPFQIYGQAFIVGLSPPATAFAIEDGEGYWIYVSVAKTLTLYGKIPTGTQNIWCSVPAEGGWAMIGFTGINASRNASDLPLMYSIPSGITMVACYVPHTMTYLSYLSLFPQTDFLIPVGAALFCFCTASGYLAYVP